MSYPRPIQPYNYLIWQDSPFKKNREIPALSLWTAPNLF
jgi:hypothetical protein